MNTLHVHDSLTLSGNAVPQDVEVAAARITPFISKRSRQVHHQYKFYCSKSPQLFCNAPDDDENTGNMGPYDDDGN